MRILNPILLSSLLLTGLAVHFQSIEYRSSEKLQKSDSVQQHLLADQPDEEIAHRGSGRKERGAYSYGLSRNKVSILTVG